MSPVPHTHCAEWRAGLSSKQGEKAMLKQASITSVDLSRSASRLRQEARFILRRSVQGYPALPGSVHPVTAAYYRGCDTYLPLRFSGAMRQVYVVCLHQDAQGILRLS